MSAKWINPQDFEREMALVGWMASVSTDKDADFIKVAKHCIKSGHFTPTRLMRFIFEIECSRVVSHEFVRHEVGVIKVQQSQRYVNAIGANYYTPPEFKDSGNYDRAIGDSFYNYIEMTEDGYSKEMARYVLTNAAMTKLRVCFNFEGLANFFHKRLCFRAQPEMQELAKDIYREIITYSPPEYHSLLFEHFGKKCDIVGYCTEVQCCGYRPTREKFMQTYERGRFIEEGA